jgi:hypothetical protein
VPKPYPGNVGFENRRNAMEQIRSPKRGAFPSPEYFGRQFRKFSLFGALAVSALIGLYSTSAKAWYWLPWGTENGGPPAGAFIGGSEIVLNSTRLRQLYICQIEDASIGTHPGKVVEGYCNVGYDSKERKYGAYRVLVDVNPSAVRWIGQSNGSVPPGAFEGGREPARILYVCRGHYNNGVHPGKVVDSACNIPWGGLEPHLQTYEVLVIGP